MNETIDRLLDARRTRPRGGRVAGLLVAMALHGGAVALAVFGPELFREERRPITYVPVVLVPPPALGTPNAKPAPPKADPKPPEPKPEPPKPKPEPPKPEPAKPKPAAPTLPSPSAKPRETSPPEPTPAEPAPAPPDSRPDTPPESTPGPAGRPGSPQGSPNSDLSQSTAVAGIDNPNFTYGYYLDRMLAIIRAQWVRPPAGSDVSTMVHFRIRTDGSVVDLEVVQASGNPAYDLSALRAVQAASPLPPLPRSYREDTLGVNLIFR